jgi:hypothetical protein
MAIDLVKELPALLLSRTYRLLGALMPRYSLPLGTA